MKYKPQTKEELQKLVQDENVYLGDIDTSLIADMSKLFVNINRVNFDGIEKWDTSNVINMSAMFMGNVNFNSNIKDWNVSKVTNISGMFSGCENFNQSLNNWNICNVREMNLCFLELTLSISHWINGILQMLKR